MAPHTESKQGHRRPNQSSATLLSTFLCSGPTPPSGASLPPHSRIINRRAGLLSSKSAFPHPWGARECEDRAALYPCPPPKALTYSNSPTFHLQSLIRNHFLSPGTILVCHLSCPPNPSFSSLGALVFPHSEDTIRGTHHLHPRTHRPGDWARLAYRRQDAPQGAELAIRGGDGQVFPLPRRVAGAPSPSQMCWLHMVWIKKNRTA